MRQSSQLWAARETPARFRTTWIMRHIKGSQASALIQSDPIRLQNHLVDDEIADEDMTDEDMTDEDMGST
ncbi:hypothetical protein [Bradyrhizobium sp.]|jgi:hypothetical protein|uniref:hypothetical protein n=1 Tax=Bradyrhizobium sp. TaxID=376 RepID=UPI003D1206B8